MEVEVWGGARAGVGVRALGCAPACSFSAPAR